MRRACGAAGLRKRPEGLRNDREAGDPSLGAGPRTGASMRLGVSTCKHLHSRLLTRSFVQDMGASSLFAISWWQLGRRQQSPSRKACPPAAAALRHGPANTSTIVGAMGTPESP